MNYTTMKRASLIITLLLFLVFLWSWFSNSSLVYSLDRLLGSDDGDMLFGLCFILFLVSTIISITIHVMAARRSEKK